MHDLVKLLSVVGVVGLLVVLQAANGGPVVRGLSGGATPSGNWPGCADSVPAPAHAAGYNTEIFCDHFAAGLPTIDKTNVCITSGCPSNQFNWFAGFGWPGLAQGNTFWDAPNVNPSSSFANHTGGVGLDYTAQTPYFAYFNGSANTGNIMSSCATTGTAGKWYGVAIPAASYIRWEVFSANSGTGGTTDAEWAMPTEFIAATAPGTGFVEVDDNESTLAKAFYWNAGGTTQSGSNQGVWPISPLIVWARMIVKMSDNGGTGYLRGFQNDNNANQPSSTWPVTWTSNSSTPGSMENQHMCMMINGPGGGTINIKSVQVFSKYPLVAGYP